MAELNTSADVFVGMRSRLDKNAKRVEEVGAKRTSQGPASFTARKKRNFVTRAPTRRARERKRDNSPPRRYYLSLIVTRRSRH